MTLCTHVQNTQVSESTEFKKSYWRERATAEEIRKNGKISVDIWAYHGDSTKLALWWDHPLDRKKNPTASRQYSVPCYHSFCNLLIMTGFTNEQVTSRNCAPSLLMFHISQSRLSTSWEAPRGRSCMLSTSSLYTSVQ